MQKTSPRDTVLLVLSSVDRLPGAPAATGNYLREVAWPAIALEQAGYPAFFLTPTGRPPLVRGNEAYGLPPDAPSDSLLSQFVLRRLRDARLTPVLSPEEAAGHSFAAIFYTGSLGALEDLATDGRIAVLARRVYEAGGVIAASGHGCAGLLPIRIAGGTPLVAGRRLACFTRDEDLAFFVQRLGWRNVPPYHVESRLREARARLASGEAFSVTVVRDGQLLTGQNAGSVKQLTAELIRALARR